MPNTGDGTNVVDLFLASADVAAMQANLDLDGAVIGPASATDNAVVRFDATTGKLVQDSGILVDDSNNVTIPGILALTKTEGVTGLSDKGGQVFNVRAYGATGDGATDDYAAFASAIAAIGASGGILYLPPGVYVVNTTLAITNPISIIGCGPTITSLFRTSGTTDVLTYSQVTGVRLAGLTIDGNSLAGRCIYADRINQSTLANLIIRGPTDFGVEIGTVSASANDGSSYNTFSNVNINLPESSMAGGLKLFGNSGLTSNACHNVFQNLRVLHYDGVGIDIINADNNSFYLTHVLRPSGTAYSVVFRDEARGNYFYHLEAKGGVSAEAPSDASYGNAIYGYDRENGQPAPTIAAGAKLSHTVDGRSSTGWVLAQGLGCLSGAVSSGASVPSFSNSGTRGFYAASSDGTTVEAKLEGLGDSTTVLYEAFGKTGASAQVRVRFGATSGGVGTINVVTNHPLQINTGNTTRLTVGATGGFIVADANHIAVGTITGTKIGTSIEQLLGFWNATPVVRPTGWGAPTGTATRTTFATSTVTMEQLAERVKALIDDLTTIGLIGA